MTISENVEREKALREAEWIFDCLKYCNDYRSYMVLRSVLSDLVYYGLISFEMFCILDSILVRYLNLTLRSKWTTPHDLRSAIEDFWKKIDC